MSRSAPVDLPEDHCRLVRGILAAHLPEDSTAWVFGSRATGLARSLSDLDLAIDAGRRLSLDEIAGLVDAFAESDLPYKVDVVDWHGIDERFRQMITAERQELGGSLAPKASGIARSGARTQSR
jgi:uncharacterized protein